MSVHVRSLFAFLAVLAAFLLPPAAASAAPAPVRETPPAGVAAVTGSAPGPAAAAARRLCSGHGIEYGDWVNADPASRSIVRAELRDCQPVTRCTGDICSIVHDAGWTVRLFGSCSPTACDWGWSAGQFRLSSGQIYAYYDQGFARRYVWAAMSLYRPGQLWIAVRTDFVDPGRADYESQNWFVRA